MRETRVCLRAVNAESQMLSGLGTIGKLLGKLPDSYGKGWYQHHEEHWDGDMGNVFQQWMDREGRQAVSQKVEKMNSRLVQE